jgi:hypothetical protein
MIASLSSCSGRNDRLVVGRLGNRVGSLRARTTLSLAILNTTTEAAPPFDCAQGRLFAVFKGLVLRLPGVRHFSPGLGEVESAGWD